MNKDLILFLFTITTLSYSNSQEVISQNKLLSCGQIIKANDFQKALNAGKTYKITLRCSPVGSGEKKEVESSTKNSIYYFEEEHNLVWVKFTAIKTAKLEFKIIPDSPADDYDFLLFKNEGKGTFQKIISKELKPVRSNIARTKSINEGITGLNNDSKQTHIKSGLNTGFSKSIDVIEGEAYYLAIDNVYDNGKGALIIFDYINTKTIKGVITDADKTPIQADITWGNSNTGEDIVNTTSDSKTGAFKFTVPYSLHPDSNYLLTVFSDDHFFTEINYTSTEIDDCEPVPIKILLPKLEKGTRIKLHNINFKGGQFVFLKSAKPTLRRLARLMKKNPTLTILIEGHTNGCPGGQSSSQVLSENRASAVRNYLNKNGISEDRITTKGYNCKFMLYPINSSEKFQSLNRRVEIIVTDY